MKRGSAMAVCGGGTGGHIFPALAVADMLRRNRHDRKLYYFGKKDGMERGLMERAQIPFYGLDVAGFARSLSLRNAVACWKAALAFRQARAWLRQLEVGAVLGTGGFVCGPVMAAAASLQIPTVIHESNYIPGLTNRWLARWVTKIAVSHSETGRYFPEHKVVVTGFPLRPNLTAPSREQGCACFGLDPKRKVLFVFPGSLAARKINKAVADLLPRLEKRLPGVQLLWMTGAADLTMALRVSEGRPGKIVVRPFIHEVAEAYAAADLVVARAGAGTVAELAAAGKPALLVPYPYATDNHQAHNALLLQKAGTAQVLEDRLADGTTLLKTVARMFKRLPDLTACAAVLQADYPKKAAEDLAAMMEQMAAGGK